VTFQVKGLNDLLSTLDSKIAKRALSTTFKEMGNSAKTAISDKIRDDWKKISKKDVDSNITVASRGERADIVIHSKPLNMIQLSAVSIQRGIGNQLERVTKRGASLAKRLRGGMQLGVTVQTPNGNIYLKESFIRQRRRDNQPFVFYRPGSGRKISYKNLITVSSIAKKRLSIVKDLIEGKILIKGEPKAGFIDSLIRNYNFFQNNPNAGRFTKGKK